MMQTTRNLVRNLPNIHKTCSHFCATLLALITTATDPQYLDEVGRLSQSNAISNSDLDFIGFKLQSISCMQNHVMHEPQIMHAQKSSHENYIMHAKNVKHATQIMLASNILHALHIMHPRNIMHAKNIMHANCCMIILQHAHNNMTVRFSFIFFWGGVSSHKVFPLSSYFLVVYF